MTIPPDTTPPEPPGPNPEAEPTIGITPEERQRSYAQASAAHASERAILGAPEIPGYRITRVVSQRKSQ